MKDFAEAKADEVLFKKIATRLTDEEAALVKLVNGGDSTKADALQKVRDALKLVNG